MGNGSIDGNTDEVINTLTDIDNPVNGSEAPIAEPLTPNSVRVSFGITVPAYMSDSLQVRLVWEGKEFAARWIGDEFWSVSRDFPTNTTQPLSVTFYDQDGDLILGRYEHMLSIDTSPLHVEMTADQFNSGQWDSDGDGTSNLAELIAGSDPLGSTRVLLFSETRGFRHDSISIALDTLEAMALANNMQVDRASDSEGVFIQSNLAIYDAVVWVLTSGDVLDANEQAAFEQYIRSGGGYVGIHAASDTEYEWPWYGNLVGAYFDQHPAIQRATQLVEDRTHASTAHLNSTWSRNDEWYNYRTNPRSRVNVLLSLDEESYTGGTMGVDHPSAWYHNFDGGRSWYTGGGHTNDSYLEPEFRTHLLGGLQYAVGLMH